MASVTFMGNPLTLSGPQPAVGAKLPDATLLDSGLAPVALSSFFDKPLVLVTVPSLDTPVCSLESRRFEQEAAGLAGKAHVVVVSMDLPFAQKRWADESGIAHAKILSDHRDAALGLATGLLVKELRLLARAVFVVKAGGVVGYAQLVTEITNEPDYDAVLAEVRKLI